MEFEGAAICILGCLSIMPKVFSAYLFGTTSVNWKLNVNEQKKKKIQSVYDNKQKLETAREKCLENENILDFKIFIALKREILKVLLSMSSSNFFFQC